MIIIRTVCDQCGEILIRSSDVHLHLSGDRTHDYFEFECPRCGTYGCGEADEQFTKVLLQNGVKPDVEEVTKTITTPLTWDDYLDFKLDLRRSIFDKEIDELSKHSC